MKKFLAILFLSMSSPFVMGVAFSNELFKENAIDFNSENVQVSKIELFIPIGFDKDKKFSYLYKTNAENVGCEFWTFKLISLSSDKVLENIKTSDYDCFKLKVNPFLTVFERRINTLLKKHKIEKRDMVLDFFPLNTSGKKINACISKRYKTISEGAVIKYNRKIIIFDRANEKAKVIANFQDVEFTGQLEVFNPKIEGYFRNNKTARLAVVVSYELRGEAGDNNIRRVNVYESNLKIDKNKDLLSICENNTIENSSRSNNRENKVVLTRELLTLESDKLSINYPAFLKAKTENNGWLKFSHEVLLQHEQWKDGKDGVKASSSYTDFSFNVKYYPSLKLALRENYIQDYNLEGDFPSNGPVQKVDIGYKIRTGVGGVGNYYYLAIKENGILVFNSPYNINPVEFLKDTQPSNLLSSDYKSRLEKSIIENTRIIKTVSATEKTLENQESINKGKNSQKIENEIIKLNITKQSTLKDPKFLFQKEESNEQAKTELKIQNESIPTSVISNVKTTIVEKKTITSDSIQKKEKISKEKIMPSQVQQESSSGGSLPLSLLVPLLGLLAFKLS